MQNITRKLHTKSARQHLLKKGKITFCEQLYTEMPFNICLKVWNNIIQTILHSKYIQNIM